MLKSDASRRRTIRIAELEEHLAAANALIEKATTNIKSALSALDSDNGMKQLIAYNKCYELLAAIERHQKGEK